jgi:hypothetical protein
MHVILSFDSHVFALDEATANVDLAKNLFDFN